MRIIHIIFSKGFAGTERYLCNLANYQSSDNSVCIIKINTSNNLLFKKNIIKNVKIFNINNFFKKLKIKKIIREISPDIIHTHLGGASKIVDTSNFDRSQQKPLYMDENGKVSLNINDTEYYVVPKVGYVDPNNLELSTNIDKNVINDKKTYPIRQDIPKGMQDLNRGMQDQNRNMQDQNRNIQDQDRNMQDQNMNLTDNSTGMKGSFGTFDNINNQDQKSDLINPQITTHNDISDCIQMTPFKEVHVQGANSKCNIDQNLVSIDNLNS